MQTKFYFYICAASLISAVAGGIATRYLSSPVVINSTSGNGLNYSAGVSFRWIKFGMSEYSEEKCKRNAAYVLNETRNAGEPSFSNLNLLHVSYFNGVKYVSAILCHPNEPNALALTFSDSRDIEKDEGIRINSEIDNMFTKRMKSTSGTIK